MGALSRRKGAEYERRIARLFREAFPDAKRELSQTRSGSEGADVANVPWWVECKHHKGRVDVDAAYAQAFEARNASPGVSRKLPIVVVWRISGTRTDYATLSLGDLSERCMKAFWSDYSPGVSDPLVTLELDAFLALLRSGGTGQPASSDNLRTDATTARP